MNFTSLGTCVLYAGLAGLFTWGVTALGAAMVLLTRRFSSRGLDCMLGFGAGSCWPPRFGRCLLGLDQAEALAMNGWLTAALGLLCGAAAVDLGGRLCHRLNLARHNSSSVRRCRTLAHWPSPCTISPRAWLWALPLALWPGAAAWRP